MVGSCSEQIVTMLSASNEWPQIKERDQEQDQEGGGARLMEKPSQEQIQSQQQPLKCPRCESTNTKFCYYNNYSLSQPRHFCKACKRYWTRGGTLRTVPVGGGCRKNKRIRRISNPNISTNTTTSESNTSESNTFNPTLLYGLPTNLAPPPHNHHGFPFSSSYDHLGGIGLGFSSSGMMLSGGDHRINGYSNTPKQILHDLISNSNPTSLFNTSNSTTTTLPTMSSLLSSTLHQHQNKFNFETLFPYHGLGGHGNEGGYMKEDSVKLEGDGQCQNGYDQIHQEQQQQQQAMGESDPSMLWNTNNSNGNSIGVNWLDPNYSNLGSSSVPSLI